MTPRQTRLLARYEQAGWATTVKVGTASAAALTERRRIDLDRLRPVTPAEPVRVA